MKSQKFAKKAAGACRRVTGHVVISVREARSARARFGGMFKKAQERLKKVGARDPNVPRPADTRFEERNAHRCVQEHDGAQS